jgi:N-methylhydantoinase A
MRVAVDTGGTFTDIVFVKDGTLRANKVPSTPSDPSVAVLEGIANLQVTTLIHGSTVATNAFLERKGARIAFLTTAGFEDILFIGRQARSNLYDLNVEKPAPIVLEEDCFGVKERITAKGEVLTPLSAQEQERCLSFLKKRPVESVAICFLHAYLYPKHEQILKNAISSLHLPVSVSSEILPEFREFERASTTAINAYLSPIMSRYLIRLKEKLPKTALYIQQSNGGWLKAEEAGQLAAHTVLSGPAGGVSGAFSWAKKLGENKIITFDMGGTSTDVCLVDGRIPFTKEYILDGFPLSLPVIDIHTVGAGGGSIAYLDAGGVLKVGPQSAGADPGPACYGKGNLPTVTDANVVLGRILPEYFLNGRFQLYPERSRKAIFKLAQKMQISVEEAALGIIEVANVNMIRALRKVSLERGYDPQAFSLFCFGGASGLHACALARELGVRRVLIPKLASVLSAFGLLFAPPLKDFSRTIWLKADKGSKNRLKEALLELKKQATFQMKQMGFLEDELEYEYFLDMRYQGQGYELSIPLEDDYISAFHDEHKRQFGHSYQDFPIEIVTLRLRVRGLQKEIEWQLKPEGKEVPLMQTKVFTKKGWLEVSVIDWNRLKIGEQFRGPALVVEPFTTVWIEPEFFVEVGENYTLILRYEGYTSN